MRIVQTSYPIVEPIDVATARLQCRMDLDDDDPLFGVYIPGARRLCEAYAHLAFISRTYTFIADRWSSPFPSGLAATLGPWGMAGGTLYTAQGRVDALRLPLGPVASVDQVRFTDTSGSVQAWDASQYVASLGNPGRISPRQSVYWPPLAVEADAVQVDATVGYGATPAEVPEPALVAMLLLIAHWYKTRAAVVPADLSEAPFGVKDSLDALGCGANLFG